MTRICVLRQSYFPGDVHVKRNVDALLDGGYEADVVCLRGEGEPARDRYRDGLVVRLPLTHKRTGNLRYAFEYLAFFLMAIAVVTWLQIRRRYRTIEVYNLPDFLVLAALPARLMGARVLFHMFEVMPEQAAEQLGSNESHPIVRALRRVQGIAVRFADAVVVVSTYDAGLIARHRPRLPPLVLPNVPVEGLFEPGASSPAGEDGRFVILTHGSILPRYGIETAIRGMPAILEGLPDAELRIVGEGEDRPRLESLAASLGVGDRVRFTGWLPYADVPTALHEADLCVVPLAVPWLLPNKIFEYAATARPILAARTPSLSGVFDGSIAYFAPSSGSDFAQQVLALARDLEARQRLGLEARRVYERHRWRVVSEAYLALHARLAERR